MRLGCRCLLLQTSLLSQDPCLAWSRPGRERADSPPVDDVDVKTGRGPTVECETAVVTQLRRLSGTANVQIPGTMMGSNWNILAVDSMNQPVNRKLLKSY